MDRSRLSGTGGSPTEFLRDYLSGVRGQEEEGDEEEEEEEEEEEGVRREVDVLQSYVSINGALKSVSCFCFVSWHVLPEVSFFCFG